MKIANDNSKLSFLLPFCHSCESRNPGLWRVRRERQRHWILYLPGSPIRSSITNVGDKRRGQASRMTEWGGGEDDRGGEGGDDRQKQKDKTLDPRLLMSRMTEGGRRG